jgi:magnesium transporter
VYVAYVTDEKRKLLGTVSFKELLFAGASEIIGEIMTEEVIYATTVDDREYAADTIAKYGLLALPIVDKEDRLVGIITVDDAIDVINEEATEDIEIMAAITPTDKPYMKTGVFETWKKRFPWLLILMLAAVFSSAVITHYENAIGTYAVLTVFFPMLMNTGGNAGSQSSVAIIRAMSLGEITMKNFFRVLWKEFRVSMLCGACLAIVCFIKTIIVDFRFQATEVFENGFVRDNFKVAAVVSATAFFAVVVAKVVGTLLPMLAKKIKLDPAVMASPFITTIVDTVTLVIYFSIASKVLGL